MHRRRLGFTQQEIIDLLKSMGAIGLAFAIMYTGIQAITTVAFYYILAIAIVTVGIGFLLHELAHKLLAQHYGCIAAYKANNKMLLFTLGISLLGFLFAAPGAVHIQGSMSKKHNALISAAGPLTNMGLALLFIPLAIIGGELVSIIGLIGASINSWIAIFNLIPVRPFDGASIINYNKKTYYIVAATALLLHLAITFLL